MDPSEAIVPSILPEAVYSKNDDYDAMLALLDKEAKFYDQRRQIIRKELGVVEEQMKQTVAKASKGLEQAQKDHQSANSSMKQMEQALISSQQTQIIANKLKQLEQLKKMN